MNEQETREEAATPNVEVLEADPVKESSKDTVRRLTSPPDGVSRSMINYVDGPIVSQDMSKAAMMDAIDRFIDLAEAVDRLKIACLKVTNRHDWVAHTSETDTHGVPYLQASGCRKIKRLFTIETRMFPDERGDLCRYEPHNDGTYEYVYQGWMRSVSIDPSWTFVIGSRWSGDKFFSRGDRVRVDPGDVRKAALTNFDQGGIKKVLGLERISWEDLEAFAGIKRSSVPTVDVGSKGKGKSGGGDAAGDKARIKDGPHIRVYLQGKHAKARDELKKCKLWNFAANENPPYWEVPFSKEIFGTIVDFNANDSSIKFELCKVPDEDVP